MHPAEAIASRAGASSSTAPPSAASSAAPDARAQVVASGTGCTVATWLISITPVTNTHSMRTRGKAGIAQPVDRLNLHAVPISPLPRSIRDALLDPNWCAAMQAEYDALLTNNTWSLVPWPPGLNLVTSK